MPTLGLEFEVYCASCGEGLCNNCEEGTTKGRNMPIIKIEPCSKCIDAAEDAGHAAGYKEREKEELTGDGK